MISLLFGQLGLKNGYSAPIVTMKMYFGSGRFIWNVVTIMQGSFLNQFVFLQFIYLKIFILPNFR